MQAEYRIRRGIPLQEEVLRIAHSLADEALARLDGPERSGIEEAIHEARKRCKEARGLLRLVRPALGAEYSKTNRLFRDAGRALAPVRDAHAAVDTFDAMVAADPGLIPDRGILEARAKLSDRAERATEAILGEEKQRVAEARNLISSAQARADSWEIANRFEPIGGGMKKTYKRGHKRFRESLDERDPEHFHEWRKRVKYLWYQVRLVSDAAPSMLEPFGRRLHDLSDALGDAHDLALIAADAATWTDVHSTERESAVEMARVRRADLEDRAVALGMRLFAERPGAFVQRMETYWNAWQAKEERRAGEIEDLFQAGDHLGNRTFEELYELAKEADLSGRSTMSRDELEKALRASGVR